ncbi:glycosyltransferase family 2 protein [Niallia taxi]|uniref:glycosyltransferase family 2 protein n=1 Tax=Niallia taxi TaxID=2499688 RepID=UPI0015F4BFB8|nr:glycosyltransferase family 2 protein [Niallia taxi]MED3964050.1 glycosyltransferase family 2 protein [Niallia taxi]
MIISIILPVYNGEYYIKPLIKKIREQEISAEIEIIAAVSKSTDNSLNVCRDICDISYLVENFNHAKTRHEAAIKASGEVLVFITQDITPYDKYWLKNLVEPLIQDNDIVATYSRQIAYPDSTETEKLIREFNYPDYDRICNINSKSKWGRKNIYYSDAASATLKEEFLKLGGYDFNIGTNEDVIYALKVIGNGKSILYNSQSKVYHSHDFEMKSAYKRYKLIGSFEKKYEKELKEYSSLGEGKKLLIYLIISLSKKFKFKELIFLFLDLSIRYFGYRKGYTAE